MTAVVDKQPKGTALEAGAVIRRRCECVLIAGDYANNECTIVHPPAGSLASDTN